MKNLCEFLVICGAALALCLFTTTAKAEESPSESPSENARPYIDLLLSFPDNETGEITPVDIRALINSYTAYHGQIRLTEISTTTINAINTWYSVTGVWAQCPNSRGVTSSFEDGIGKICNNTGLTFLFVISVSASLEATSSNNQTFIVGLKPDNGNVLDCLLLYGESRFSQIYVNVSGSTTYKMADGECIDLVVQNTSGTDNFSFASVILHMKVLPPAVDH